MKTFNGLLGFCIVLNIVFISDEDLVHDSSELEAAESTIPDMLRDMWESQFVPVGQHLLQRVKSHHTDLVPLDAPS